MLCTPASGDLQDEEERRHRRKSGIRLDDMSVETPVSSNYPTNEQKDYYAGGGGGGGVYETNDHRHRHDSYDIYQHNNNSTYNETYSRNNGGAYY